MNEYSQEEIRFQQLSILSSNLQVQQLKMSDAEVRFYPDSFNKTTCDCIFDTLQQEIVWRRDSTILFGRHHLLPRLTAWYGDPGKSYAYSGIYMNPLPWTSTLLWIKAAIEPVAKVKFNSVLLNLLPSWSRQYGLA